MKMHKSRFSAAILLAGLAGGIAEIVWVSAYAALSPADGAEIAREITISVFGIAASGAYAPVLGVVIHMLLAVAVAAAFVAALWHPIFTRFGNGGVMAAALVTLAAIWLMNFFVVLPAINPVFVALMPLPVTLVSKLLFGLAMGLALAMEARAGIEPTYGDLQSPA
jgi:hypothetical protein